MLKSFRCFAIPAVAKHTSKVTDKLSQPATKFVTLRVTFSVDLTPFAPLLRPKHDEFFCFSNLFFMSRAVYRSNLGTIVWAEILALNFCLC